MLRSLVFGLLFCCAGLAAAQTDPAGVPPPAYDPVASLAPAPPIFAPALNGGSLRSESSGELRVSGAVMAGRLLHRVDPVYPAEARAERISGTVLLSARIGEDGLVRSAGILSGPTALTASALAAVRQWSYQPYRLHGAPVEVSTVVRITFQPLPPATDSGVPRR